MAIVWDDVVTMNIVTTEGEQEGKEVSSLLFLAVLAYALSKERR